MNRIAKFVAPLVLLIGGAAQAQGFGVGGLWTGGGGGGVAASLACLLSGGSACTMAGTVVSNTAGGTNAAFSETGIDRSSGSSETFDITNAGAGVMELRVDGSKVWTAANDGAVSGLDADLLDGSSSAAFCQVAGAANCTLTGTLVSNTAGGTDAVLSETGLDRSSASAETFNFQNSGAGAMTLQVDGSTVCSQATDGAGSGCDADTVDGISSAAFALVAGTAFSGNVTTTGGAFIQAGASSSSTSASIGVTNSESSGTGNIVARGSAVAGTRFGINLADAVDLVVSGAANFLLGTSDSTPVTFGANNVKVVQFTGAGDVVVTGSSSPYVQPQATTSGTSASIGSYNSESAATVNCVARGSAVAGTRFGINLADATDCVASGAGSGLLIGTSDDEPVVFGSNNAEVYRIDDTQFFIHTKQVTTLNSTDCDAAAEVGRQVMYSKSAANKITLCVCEQTNTATFAWGAATAAGDCT